MDALRYSEAVTTGIFLILLGTVVITLLRRIAGRADPMSDVSQ
jgi:raffinose/stachyose/melibiose transport system permease protein